MEESKSEFFSLFSVRRKKKVEKSKEFEYKENVKK